MIIRKIPNWLILNPDGSVAVEFSGRLQDAEKVANGRKIVPAHPASTTTSTSD